MSFTDLALGFCWLLALGGTFFVLIGAIGMLRAPDVYTRIHAASVTDTSGASLIIFCLVAYALIVGYGPMIIIKLLLTYFFIMFTSPTASHAVAKTALMNQLLPINKNGKAIVDKDLLDSLQTKSQK